MSASFQLGTIDDLPCVVRGPEIGPGVLLIQPLFEEMNRTRRLLAQITGRLAAAGVRSWMPDLPGTGDALGEMNWADWQHKILSFHTNIESQHSEIVRIIAIRGGSLLANEFPDRYVLSPVMTGAVIIRDLLRTRAMANPDSPTERVESLAARLKSEPLDLAGYPISPVMASALERATTDTAGARVVTVGDGGFAGPPVWRQSEPADASLLADDIAADIKSWIASCASH